MNSGQFYSFDDNSRIWTRKDAQAFHYSDGDMVENGIGYILQGVKDRSVFSDELKTLQHDWPTTYYFSANRSNLLRPLTEKLIAGARILELGCGMGAVTRYLGENAKEVVAVEGSARRGSIAAIRCEDLDNVQIIIDEIKALPECLGSFDVVTLIGVLEYARKYGGPGAEREVLEKAKSFLKPDGALILAIENKLGLKYFGGIPEDHLQKSWLGLTNGYAENGVRTWSRKELLELLTDAGFEHCQQFIALPDYKLLTTVITPAGLAAKKSTLDLTPFFNNTRRAFEGLPVFNGPEAWESVCHAGLLEDLADSLCIVAYNSPAACDAFDDRTLVYHYGELGRLSKKYSKEMTIINEGGEMKVKRKKLDASCGSEQDDFQQIVQDESYLSGELLFSKIRKIAMRPDWSVNELIEAFEPWAKMLRENADENWTCDGNLLDFTPFNIIMDGDQPRPFDQEWVSRNRVPLPNLLYRGFFNTIVRMMPLRKSSRHNLELFSELFNEFIKAQKLHPSLPVSLPYLGWQETKFQNFIRGHSGFRQPKDFKLIYM